MNTLKLDKVPKLLVSMETFQYTDNIYISGMFHFLSHLVYRVSKSGMHFVMQIPWPMFLQGFDHPGNLLLMQ